MPDIPPVWQVEDPPALPPDFSGPEGPPGRDWDPVCDNFWQYPNAAALSAFMRGQSLGAKVQDTAGPYMGAASSLATVVSIGSMIFTRGAAGPISKVSSIIATGISVADTVSEVSEKVLPGELTRLTFDYNSPLYLEDDEDLTGYWADVMLTARSEGMFLDGIILSAVMGKAGGYLSNRFIGQHIDPEIIRRAVQYQGGLVGGGIASKIMDKIGDARGLIYVPGCEFGPVDITEEGYHYAEFEPADGPAVITGHQAFEIVEVGDADFVIRAAPEKFGGYTISQRGPVIVKPIEVTINPEQVDGDPGYTATFLVTIENARNAGAAFTLVPGAGHAMEYDFIEPNMYEITVTTSEDGDNFPTTLIAESISGTGLRAKAGAPPREARALLTSGGGLEISPWSSCVERGGTVQFEADVMGYDNKRVMWEAGGGTVSPSGLFTAPEEDGQYVVRAVSAADPHTFDEAVVRVAEQCACWAAIGHAGAISTTGDVRLSFYSEDLKQSIYDSPTLWMTFEDEGTVLDGIYFTFSSPRGTTSSWAQWCAGCGSFMEGLGDGPKEDGETPSWMQGYFDLIVTEVTEAREGGDGLMWFEGEIYGARVGLPPDRDHAARRACGGFMCSPLTVVNSPLRGQFQGLFYQKSPTSIDFHCAVPGED